MTIGFRIDRLFSCFVFVTVLSGSADVQVSSETPTDVSAVLEAFRARHQTPGMVALVLRGDRIVATGAVGVRREHSAERVTLEDVFHLGSCTKAMTATLAAMIVEEGRIGWETTIGAVFGNTVKNMDRSWRDVTLRQTLAHRAGFRSGNDLWGLLDRRVVEVGTGPDPLRATRP